MLALTCRALANAVFALTLFTFALLTWGHFLLYRLRSTASGEKQ